MKTQLCKLLAFLLALSLLPLSALAAEIELYPAEPVPQASATDNMAQISQSPLLETPPISLNCGSALLIEAGSGQIIFEMNAATARPAASITKIMTILLTLEALEQGRIAIDQRVTISPNASGMGGSQVLLDTGEVQTVDVLLKSAIVGSANDACVALAELMYGSEELCVKRMNERAAELGMESTAFVNCTGLPASGQYTTARDIAIMTMAMLQHPRYFEYSQIWMDEVVHPENRVTQLTNTNKLIRLYDGCDGGKTGSTNEAGYCVSATATRGGMRLIAVVLAADSGTERFDIAQDMFDYGFANYRLYPVAQRGTKIRGELSVEGGRPDSIPLILNEDLTLLVGKGDEQRIRLVPELPETLTAPIESGQTVGHICVELDGRTLARLPISAAAASEVKGLKNALQQLMKSWIID